MGLTAQIKGLILCSSCCFSSPFLQKPQGSGFIVLSVLSSLKITHKANKWLVAVYFPWEYRWVQVHNALFTPNKNMQSEICTSSRLLSVSQSDMLLWRDINQMLTVWKCESSSPIKMYEDYTMGQMFRLHLAFFMCRNLDLFFFFNK